MFEENFCYWREKCDCKIILELFYSLDFFFQLNMKKVHLSNMRPLHSAPLWNLKFKNLPDTYSRLQGCPTSFSQAIPSNPHHYASFDLKYWICPCLELIIILTLMEIIMIPCLLIYFDSPRSSVFEDFSIQLPRFILQTKVLYSLIISKNFRL